MQTLAEQHEIGEPIDNDFLIKAKFNENKILANIFNKTPKELSPTDITALDVIMDGTHLRQFSIGHNVQTQLDNTDTKLISLHCAISDLKDEIQNQIKNDCYKFMQIDKQNLDRDYIISKQSADVAFIVDSFYHLVEKNKVQDNLIASQAKRIEYLENFINRMK